MQSLNSTTGARDTDQYAVGDGFAGGEVPMTVLMVHNEYRQPGGEDIVFFQEASLLESHGHRVIRYQVHNDRTAEMGPATLATKTVWNSSAYRELSTLIRKEQPRIVHFHNTFPLVSPAGYYAAAGVPVVQTLHNYRLLCPNGLFFRDGRPCEDCLGKAVPLPGVVHGCYRGNRGATSVVTAMLATHRAVGTWARKVDLYVALTEFARRKYIEGGLPVDRLVVKPNFVSPDPGPGDGDGGYALFVGRLSPEKGLGTLIDAWRGRRAAMPLKVVGDGPLANLVRRASRKNPRIELLGRRSIEEVHALMRRAAVLVFPSELYETFGRVAVEAFAAGTPVVAADIGAAAELVDHGRTGVLFRRGDAEDLSVQVRRLARHPHELETMRKVARAEFENKYTAERNYLMLMKIYQSVVARVGARS
jgi:glycosyltransferase involved in cell wall biosynthesis